MRILVATVPGTGHVEPLLPMVRRLHAQGDRITWATDPDQCRALAAEPFEKVEACPPMPQWFQQLSGRIRGRPFDVPTSRLPYFVVPRLFGETGVTMMLDGLLATAREQKPDVLLFDSRCYAGPLVARAVGALPVMFAVTSLLHPDVELLVNDAVTPVWRAQGLGARRPTPGSSTG